MYFALVLACALATLFDLASAGGALSCFRRPRAANGERIETCLSLLPWYEFTDDQIASWNSIQEIKHEFQKIKWTFEISDDFVSDVKFIDVTLTPINAPDNNDNSEQSSSRANSFGTRTDQQRPKRRHYKIEFLLFTYGTPLLPGDYTYRWPSNRWEKSLFEMRVRGPINRSLGTDIRHINSVSSNFPTTLDIEDAIDIMYLARGHKLPAEFDPGSFHEAHLAYFRDPFSRPRPGFPPPHLLCYAFSYLQAVIFVSFDRGLDGQHQINFVRINERTALLLNSPDPSIRNAPLGPPMRIPKGSNTSPQVFNHPS